MTRSITTTSAFFAGLLILGVGSACKKPEPVPPVVPTPVKQTASTTEESNKEAKKKQEDLEAARKAEESKRLAAEKAEALKRSAADALQDIHFDYDKSEIKGEDRNQLLKISKFLKDYPAAKVEIQGHCDERGTNEYNLALGNLRASSTMRYLIALGSDEQKFTLVSYGKERPLCTEENEACMSKNRRAHFELK